MPLRGVQLGLTLCHPHQTLPSVSCRVNYKVSHRNNYETEMEKRTMIIEDRLHRILQTIQGADSSKLLALFASNQSCYMVTLDRLHIPGSSKAVIRRHT